MPRRDGTGPMSGRFFGLCTGADKVNNGVGFGMGLRRGYRQGLGRRFGRNADLDQASSKTNKEMLQNQKDLLQSRLEMINKQLEKLAAAEAAASIGCGRG